MGSIALIAALLASTSNLPDPWLTFGMSPGHPKERVVVEVGTMPRTDAQIAADEKFEYWAKLTVRLSDLNATYWTDSRHCPQLKAIAGSVAKLEVPRLWTPERLEDEGGILVSTSAAKYELTAKATYGELFGSDLRITGQRETHLGAWFDESYRSLHGCWFRRPPAT